MISDNLNFVKSRIESVKHDQEVELIAVSKTRSISEIQEAIDAGQFHFGENYLQESLEKIASLKDLFNSPINEVLFNLKSDHQIEKIYSILADEGETIVNINLFTKGNILKFKLKNARKLDRKSLNLLRNQEIQAIIV